MPTSRNSGPAPTVRLPPQGAWRVLREAVTDGETCVVSTSVPSAAGLPRAMAAALTEPERRRATEFRSPAARNQFIIAHYLLGRIVAAVAPLRSWSFEAPDGGKPELSIGGDHLHANLSHTKGSVAVAIGRTAPLGVDIEAVAPLDNLDRLASRVLTARERKSVLGDADPERAFMQLWVRKEAATKAHGRGLLAPFDTIDVLDPETPALPPELAGPLVLRDVACPASHCLAVAALSTFLEPRSFEIPIDLMFDEAKVLTTISETPA